MADYSFSGAQRLEPMSSDAELNTLTNKALGLLARREYSRGELEERLARRSKNQLLVSQVLDALEEQGLQSDERFCDSFVRYRIAQGKGPAKIRQDLRQKHIGAQLIEQYLEQDTEFWSAQASNVYEKKYQHRPVTDEKEFAKRLRFMVSRGFSANLVYSLIERS